MVTTSFYPPIENPSNDVYNAMMRKYRNKLLTDSDWSQMPDSPLSDEQKYAWAEYRQQLRDFPATWTPGDTADFPDPPA